MHLYKPHNAIHASISVGLLMLVVVLGLIQLLPTHASAQANPTETPTLPLATTQPTPSATAQATQAAVLPPSPTALPQTLPAPQQSAALRLEITKTLVGSDLIQVGQYLTFTIRIRNTGTITVTKLPLIDEYDPAVLQPALARFQPASDTSSAGRIDWADLTDLPGFGDLRPGGEFLITTVFRAIGISDNVINRARVEAAVGSGGEGGVPIEGGDGGNVTGGRVIIEKALPEQVIRADAPAITFVITVRNDGAADLVSVPVEDTFDPTYLRFLQSSPAPDRHEPSIGLLRWDNLIGSLGIARLQPGQVVTATTTFAILAPIDNLVINRITGVNVRDEFGNAVQAPRQADVRIRIVGVADTRPTATPRAERPRQNPTEQPTEAPTSTNIPATAQAEAPTPTGEIATATSNAVNTGTAPAILPNTAGRNEPYSAIFWMGLFCITIAVVARWRAK